MSGPEMVCQLLQHILLRLDHTLEFVCGVRQLPTSRGLFSLQVALSDVDPESTQE